MIERIKMWLLEHNLENIKKKISDGKATDQDWETFERMKRYGERGYW